MASQQIYQSQFLKVLIKEEDSFMELIWEDIEGEMTKEIFKREMIVYRNLVQDYHIKLVLNDSTDGTFVVTPEVQEWIAEEIFPHTVKSLHKIAFVLPWNLIQKLAIEQMIEEYEIKDLQKIISSRYFKNRDEACQWLFS